MLKPFFKNVGQQIPNYHLLYQLLLTNTVLLGSSADDFFKSTPLTKNMNIFASTIAKSINDVVQGIDTRRYSIRYSMPKKFLRYMTGQAGQERVGLQANNVQTIGEGFKYLTAQDQVKGQRLKQQSGRIQGRIQVAGGIIGGTYGAVQGARYVSQPRLVNNLEYRNPQYYTQQPISYRDRLIRMLNNTTL